MAKAKKQLKKLLHRYQNTLGFLFTLLALFGAVAFSFGKGVLHYIGFAILMLIFLTFLLVLFGVGLSLVWKEWFN